MTERPQPPLGIIPEALWAEKVPEPRLAEITERARALLAATDRYRAAGREPPAEWGDELDRHRRTLEHMINVAIASNAALDAINVEYVEAIGRYARERSPEAFEAFLEVQRRYTAEHRRWWALNMPGIDFDELFGLGEVKP